MLSISNRLKRASLLLLREWERWESGYTTSNLVHAALSPWHRKLVHLPSLSLYREDRSRDPFYLLHRHFHRDFP
jgi:hypothetical protein